jgi:hypothetical protein
VTAQVETMKTRSHINNDVVANNWGEKVVVVGKKKDRRIVQSDPKSRHPVMKGRLKGGASDAMFNVVVCLTAKGACGFPESKSPVTAPLIKYRLEMRHM